MRLLLRSAAILGLFSSACSPAPLRSHPGVSGVIFEGDPPPPGPSGPPPLPPLPPPSLAWSECIERDRSGTDSVSHPGACAEIFLQNQMSTAFLLTSVTIAIDGNPLFKRETTDGSPVLETLHDLPIFTGKIAPGDHALQIDLLFRGNGQGVFAYLKGYKFRVKSSQTLAAAIGHPFRLHIVAYEKGSVTTPLEERPAVSFVNDDPGSSAPVQ